MREVKTTGMICVKDSQTLLEYALCRIELVEREDETFCYTFTPNYSVIDLVPPSLFQGIPGLNLDLRCEKYMRENQTPVFISERAPAENREDLHALISQQGMEYLNKLEWLIRTETRYSGDSLYVREFVEDEEDENLRVGNLGNLGINPAQTLKVLLDALCAGRNISGEGFSFDNNDRANLHAFLRCLYLREKSYLDQRRNEGIKASAEQGLYRGRKRKAVDEIKMKHTFIEYDALRLSATEAAEELGLSRATFFRRLKEFREDDSGKRG